jgi:hypothetical protein
MTRVFVMVVHAFGEKRGSPMTPIQLTSFLLVRRYRRCDGAPRVSGQRCECEYKMFVLSALFVSMGKKSPSLKERVP